MSSTPVKKAPPAPTAQPEAPTDVVLIGGPTESGEGVNVLRKRADRLEIGELRATKEGQPLHGELVRLSPRGDSGRLFDVEVLVPGPEAKPARRGPSKVVNDAYRANWDAIFGGGREEPGPLN